MSMRLSGPAAGALVCALSFQVLASPVTVNLSPVADTFVYAAQSNYTYGSAGAMNISGPATSGGPFHSAMKFDSTAAAAGFNSTFGSNQWTITSIVLQLSEDGAPTSALFPRGAGNFDISWESNDNWSEGFGTPNSPGTASGNQLSYYYLQYTLLPASIQQSLGAFASLLITGRYTYSLGIAPGFVSDVLAGDFLTLLGTPMSNTIGFTFNSSSYFDPGARPVLSITANAIPEPATTTFLIAAALGLLRRSRRPGVGLPRSS